MQRMHFLDRWRGCAILAVLFGHFATSKGINLGRYGVELFFVLSGRLMAEILFVRTTPLPRFFARRFSRIYPALLVFCALLLGVDLAWGDGGFLPHFIGSVTFSYNYAQFFIGRDVTVDHIWSLCVEEHVYILLGALAWAHRRRPLPVKSILAAAIAMAVSTGIVHTARGWDYYAVYWRTDVRGASILMGALAFLLVRQGDVRVAPPAIVPLGMASLVLNLNPVPDPLKYSVGTIALAFALAGLPQAVASVRRIAEHRMLLTAGLLSYSIYLYQQPFFAMGGGPASRLGHLSLALVAALCSFHLVEQPARTWLNRLTDRVPSREHDDSNAVVPGDDRIAA